MKRSLIEWAVMFAMFAAVVFIATKEISLSGPVLDEHRSVHLNNPMTGPVRPMERRP
jgi:hypothetical protein